MVQPVVVEADRVVRTEGTVAEAVDTVELGIRLVDELLLRTDEMVLTEAVDSVLLWPVLRGTEGV